MMFNQAHNVAFQPTFDQEGNPVTLQQIQQENLGKFRDIFNAKELEFEDALASRCKELDIPFANMGFQPQVGGVCYQVDMNVFTVQVTPEGLRPVQVGRLQ